MTTPTLYANTELVVQALLAEFFGSSDYIGTTLPIADKGGVNSWIETGFVTVNSLGGTASSEVAMMSPIVAVNCWASPKTGGSKPPYGKANNLAETIRHGCRLTRPHKVTLPGSFPEAIVFTAFLVSEPRRLPDAASYARYTFDMQVNWGPVNG